MAQYDLIFNQNTNAAGITYTERFVNIAKGGLLSAASTGVPTVLAAGTNGYYLIRDDAAATGLAWSNSVIAHTHGAILNDGTFSSGGLMNFGATTSVTATLLSDVTTTGNTKTIGFGGGGASGSTTNISIGSGTAGASTTINLYGGINLAPKTNTSALVITSGTGNYLPLQVSGGVSTFAASGDNYASIRLYAGTAPLIPANGDIWTTTTGMYVRINGATVGPLGASGSGTWTGAVIGLAYGGTNANLTAVNGGIVYSTASAMGITAVGTANQVLKSNAAAAPTWATLDLTYLPDAAFKKSVVVMANTDIAASTRTSTVLTGYSASVSLALTTTINTANVTTTSTAGIKVGAVISGNANIPVGATVLSLTDATTFVISANATASASAITSTITNTISALVIDGVTLALNERVLLNGQTSIGGRDAGVTNNVDNGIYYLSTLGSASVAWVLTRALDADTISEIAGGTVNIDRGTYGGTIYSNNLKTTDTLGTTAQPWYNLYSTANTAFTGTSTGLKATVSAGYLQVNGPTVARLMTVPDAAFSVARIDAAQTFTGVQTMTSPSITTSLVTGSTTFALVNTVATTLTFAGAATTLTIGGTPTGTITHNYSTNATASTFTKNINIGTGGVSGSTTLITLGTNIAGSTSTTLILGMLRLPYISVDGATNGDVWTKSTGLYAYINGAVVGPFITTSGSGAVGLVAQDIIPNSWVVDGVYLLLVSGLNAKVYAGTAYVNYIRVVLPSDTTRTYTINKDTYVDLNTSGGFTYVEVANGAAEPAITASSIRLGKVVTNATIITSVTQYGQHNTFLGYGAGGSGTAWKGYYNTFIGKGCGSYNSGSANSYLGYEVNVNGAGVDNVIAGFQAGAGVATGSKNVILGRTTCLYQNASNSVILGYSAGYSTTGSATIIDSIYLGSYAGTYETGNAKLIIDSYGNRGSEASSRSSAIIYGIMNSTVANQTLSLNATVTINSDLNLKENQSLYLDSDASATSRIFCDGLNALDFGPSSVIFSAEGPSMVFYTAGGTLSMIMTNTLVNITVPLYNSPTRSRPSHLLGFNPSGEFQKIEMAFQYLGGGTGATFDLGNYPNYSFTLSGNSTITLTNITNGQIGEFYLQLSGTYNLTFTTTGFTQYKNGTFTSLVTGYYLVKYHVVSSTVILLDILKYA